MYWKGRWPSGFWRWWISWSVSSAGPILAVLCKWSARRTCPNLLDWATVWRSHIWNSSWQFLSLRTLSWLRNNGKKEITNNYLIKKETIINWSLDYNCWFKHVFCFVILILCTFTFVCLYVAYFTGPVTMCVALSIPTFKITI